MPSQDERKPNRARFYAAVEVAEAGGRFETRLDGRAPKTPGGRPLALPTRALAEALAEEWRAQGAKVEAATMPMSRLANTAIDIVALAPATTVAEVALFAGDDVLCYRAEHPENLARRQEQVWGPLIGWARDSLGLAFIQTRGIAPVVQPAETMARLEARLEALDSFDLTGLAFAAPLFGSTILALALREGRLTGAEALEAARLDEAFQAEQWGLDPEAAARAEAMGREAATAQRWFEALRG